MVPYKKDSLDIFFIGFYNLINNIILYISKDGKVPSSSP